MNTSQFPRLWGHPSVPGPLGQNQVLDSSDLLLAVEFLRVSERSVFDRGWIGVGFGQAEVIGGPGLPAGVGVQVESAPCLACGGSSNGRQPAQARHLMDSVRVTPRSGARLVGFFACVYYSALRPEDAAIRHVAAVLREPDENDLPSTPT